MGGVINSAKTYLGSQFKKKLRIIIVGPIASGKGTLSENIMKEFQNFVHISPGDILRRHVQLNTLLGQEAKTYVSQGILVPDEIIVDSILDELEKAEDKNWILDGFPRTLNQAKMLHGIESFKEVDMFGHISLCDTRGLVKNPITGVINLIVPYNVVIERARNRWVHPPSGRIYSVGFREPRVRWKDDITGEDLVQRADDSPDIIAERLKIHENITVPVLDFYRYHGVYVLDLKNDNNNDVWPIVKEFLREQSMKSGNVE